MIPMDTLQDVLQDALQDAHNYHKDNEIPVSIRIEETGLKKVIIPPLEY